VAAFGIGRNFIFLKKCGHFLSGKLSSCYVLFIALLNPGTVMAKPSKKSRRNKASPPAVELAPRVAPRRSSAERRMRIL